MLQLSLGHFVLSRGAHAQALAQRAYQSCLSRRELNPTFRRMTEIRSSTETGKGMASAATYVRRVQVLAVGFLVLFVAYSAAQLLQTAVNKATGYICLLSLYACFGAAALFAPALVGKYGPTRLLWLSACGYVIMVASNLHPVPELLLPGCLTVGIAAATLWSSQGTYIGSCAAALSNATGRQMTDCASQLNASFYMIFMSSGALSNGIASVIMLSNIDNAVKVLFVFLTFSGCLGVICLAALPEAGDKSDRIFGNPFVRAAPVSYGSSESTGILSSSVADASLAEWEAVYAVPGDASDHDNADRLPRPTPGTATASASDQSTTTNAGAGPVTASTPAGPAADPSNSSPILRSASAVRRRHNTAATDGCSAESGIPLTSAGITAGAPAAQVQSSTLATLTSSPRVRPSAGSAPLLPTLQELPAAASIDGTSPASSASAPVTQVQRQSSSIVRKTSSSGPPPRPSLWFMLRFLTTNKRMRYIIPTILVTGAGNGYISGAWYGGVVGRAIGIEYVGFVGATYSLAAAIATKMWGKLAQRESFGRRWCFVLSFASHVLWYLAFTLWCAKYISDEPDAPNYPPDASREGAFAMLFIGVAWYAIFDPVFNSMVPATLQTFFPSGAEAPCAMASIRAVYSVGFATQQGISISLQGKRIAEQSLGLMFLMLFAAASLWYLHRNVCQIDLKQELAAKDHDSNADAPDVDAASAASSTTATKSTGTNAPDNTSSPV